MFGYTYSQKRQVRTSRSIVCSLYPWAASIWQKQAIEGVAWTWTVETEESVAAVVCLSVPRKGGLANWADILNPQTEINTLIAYTKTTHQPHPSLGLAPCQFITLEALVGPCPAIPHLQHYSPVVLSLTGRSGRHLPLSWGGGTFTNSTWSFCRNEIKGINM